MSLNNAELSIVLKEVIDPEVADLVERTPTLYKLIPKGGEMNARGGSDAGASGTYVSGKDGIFMYAKVQPNPSLGWFGEGGKYPAGSYGKRVKFSTGFSRVAITSRLTRDVFEGADKSAIINVVTEEIADDTKSVLKEISQQLYGDGSGKKAVVVSTGTTLASGVLGLSPMTSGVHIRGKYDIISGDDSTDRNAGGDNGTVGIGTTLATLSVGAKSNSTATFGTFATNGTFTATNLGTLTVGSDTGIDVVAGDMIVPTGSYQKCITGLDYHISSGVGTWQNISRNTYPEFRAYTYSSVGDLTVAKLYKVSNRRVRVCTELRIVVTADILPGSSTAVDVVVKTSNTLLV